MWFNKIQKFNKKRTKMLNMKKISSLQISYEVAENRKWVKSETFLCENNLSWLWIKVAKFNINIQWSDTAQHHVKFPSFLNMIMIISPDQTSIWNDWNIAIHVKYQKKLWSINNIFRVLLMSQICNKQSQNNP